MEPDARRTRIAVAAAFAAQGLGFAVLLTHLPAFEDRYGISDAVVTAIVFMVSVLAGVGSEVAARVSERRGSAFSLRLALAGVVVALAVVGLSPRLAPACVGFALYGLSVGAVDASMNMQAVGLQHRYGQSIMTSFHATWSAAGIVGALLTAGTERVDAPIWLVLVGTAAAIGLIVLGYGGRLASSTRVEASDHASSEAATPALPWRPILVIGTAIVCFYVADSGTSSWSSVYLDKTLHAHSASALAYAAYAGTSLVSRLAGDHLVRRLGAVAVVRGAGLVGALGLLLVVLAPGAGLAIAGFAVLGLGVAVVAPLSFSAAGELSPGDADAVVAQVNVFNYVGFVVGGVVLGIFGSAGHLRSGFAVPLVLCLAIVALAPAFHPGRVARRAADGAGDGADAPDGARR